MHQVALLRDRVASLEEANQILSKRRRAKKTRVRQGGSMTLQHGQDLLAQKGVQKQAGQERDGDRGGTSSGPAQQRRCRRCGNTGHNVRTCRMDTDTSREDEFHLFSAL